MTDRVRVNRDPGTADDVWDDDTGSYVPDEESTLVYEGIAYISPAGWNPQVILEAGAPTIKTTYKMSIPVDAPEVKEDDIVTCTVSDRDPTLVDQQFIVRDHILSSFSVSQRLGLDKYEPQRPR